jgi:hypothetical protein
MQGLATFTVRLALIGSVFALNPAGARAADAAMPMGFYAFGADQTIADVGKVEWQPLKLEGLPAGIEIAVLRGDLGKGGGELHRS